MTVSRSSAVGRDTSPGSQPVLAPITSLPPRNKIGTARSIIGPTWKSGPNTAVASSGPRPKPMILASDEAHVVLYVQITPLGCPVVPDECTAKREIGRRGHPFRRRPQRAVRH